ncbi:MAG: tetratricopeptide repeat protein [Chitinophagales bacterium]|nr:tetratricopeptide repeat protein [Chitinophagales bacterium]
MDLRNQLAAVRKKIAEGDTAAALNMLIAMFDSDPRCKELANAARIQQGQLAQLQQQLLRGTISGENAVIGGNQIAAATLDLAAHYEHGRFIPTEALPPSRSLLWRYLSAGGILALAAAFLIWNFFFKTQDECPEFDKSTEFRVLVLPFAQTGVKNAGKIEVEIADGLNSLIAKYPGLKAAADVKSSSAGTEYISPAEASRMGQECGVQMVVWGKINQAEADSVYKFDARYVLLNKGGVYAAGDTSVGDLLRLKSSGQRLAGDVEAVTRFLYIVLANRAKVPIASNFFAAALPKTTAQDMAGAEMRVAVADTGMILQQAYNLAISGKTEAAIGMYSDLLEQFPDFNTAREMRGALYLQKGNYENAIQDLRLVEGSETDSTLLKARVDAALKSGHVQLADDYLKLLRKVPGGDKSWIALRENNLRDSVARTEKRLQVLESAAKKKPSARSQIDLARENLKLGRNSEALKNAEAVLRKDAKNVTAYSIKAEAHLLDGDTAATRKTLETADKNKVSVKGIIEQAPVVRPLAKNDF